MIDSKGIKDRLKKLRNELKLNQSEVALEIESLFPGQGISRERISQIENPNNNDLNFVLVCFFVFKHNANLNWLLNGEGETVLKESSTLIEKTIGKIEEAGLRENLLSLISYAGANKGYLLHAIGDYYKYREVNEGSEEKKIRSVNNA